MTIDPSKRNTEGNKMAPGEKVYKELIDAAKLNGIPVNREGQVAKLANGVMIEYDCDPADARVEHSVTQELISIRRKTTCLAEGIINGPARGYSFFRVNSDLPELILPTADALVGIMLVKLIDAVAGRV